MSESGVVSSDIVVENKTQAESNSLKPNEVVVEVQPSNTNPKPSTDIPPVVTQALDILIKDPNFIKELETSVQNILKDGKIDQYDIPELVFLITNAYNSMRQIRVEYSDLPLLIKLLYNFMVDKLNLIPVDKRPEFERLVDSAIKLVMLQPAISKGINSCLSKLFSCCGPSSTKI
jgi:hypothetical protein